MKPWSAIAAVTLGASALCCAVAPLWGQQFAQYTFNEYYDLAQRDPTWSSEGTLIYLAELDSGPPAYESLYALRGWADERDVYFGILSTWDPTLSGDARRVVVVQRDWFEGDTGSALWVIDSENKRVRLTEPTEQDSDPEWFQLANLIAFTSTRSGNADIWIVSADGGGEMQVTTHTADDRQPSWFPDRRLAFVSNRGGAVGIWVQAVDSEASAVQITTGPDAEPAVSPDGKWIAFTSGRSGNADIWVVSAAGGTPIQITRDPAYDSHPLGRPTASASPSSRIVAGRSGRRTSGSPTISRYEPLWNQRLGVR